MKEIVIGAVVGMIAGYAGYWIAWRRCSRILRKHNMKGAESVYALVFMASGLSAYDVSQHRNLSVLGIMGEDSTITRIVQNGKCCVSRTEWKVMVK